MATDTPLSSRLIRTLGIAPASYERFVAWALCEHLSALASSDPALDDAFFARPDALRAFRDLLKRKFGFAFSSADYSALFERARVANRKNDRQPITYEDYLKLLWQVPLACAMCERTPPDVQLHIDHVVPASRGGSSTRVNLQFLCAQHNLRKGNRLEPGDPWLSLD